MRRRVLPVLAVILLIAVGYEAMSVRTALRSIESQRGRVDLTCYAEITNKREVTLNVSWKWTEANPHPGMKDEIVILGPDGWCSLDEPGTKPPLASGEAGQVQFGTAGEAADMIGDKVQAANVKAYAAVKPNEDGGLTVFLKTDSDPVPFDDQYSVQYLMVERVPSTSPRLTIAERILRLFSVSRVQLFTIEQQRILGPWMPNLICPGYVGEHYIPSLIVDDPNPDLRKVARDLFTDYLEHHRAPDQPEGQRLDDYVINVIDVHKEDADHFWFSVSYSVKPATMNTYWLAGNGDIQYSGWIENKGLELDVARDGNAFTVAGGGTGGHPIDPK